MGPLYQNLIGVVNWGHCLFLGTVFTIGTLANT